MKPFTHLPFTLLLTTTAACHSSSNADPVIASQAGYFNRIAANDIQLPAPRKGEWLFEHRENGQNFEAYKAARPVRPDSAKKVIYLLPIGTFTPLQQKLLSKTAEYTQIFFGLKTVLLPSCPDETIPPSARRVREDSNIQLRAPYLLDSMLMHRLPPNGIALLAISAKDLFPDNKWNYVFGQASYINRIGVSSVYRLQNKQLTANNYTLCLSRLLKITSHEIGHMLSMQHCIYAQCTMNGSNSLPETDRAPNRLCSECQQKLYWNIRYNNRQRLTLLTTFCSTNSLTTDFTLLQHDLAGL